MLTQYMNESKDNLHKEINGCGVKLELKLLLCSIDKGQRSTTYSYYNLIV